MALSVPFYGSGRFVPETVWSCPVHDQDANDRGDYYDDGWSDPWESEGEICLDCETGRWLKLKDGEGNVVMRELGAWEAMLLDQATEAFNHPSVFLKMLGNETRTGQKVTWLEDAAMPSINYGEGFGS